MVHSSIVKKTFQKRRQNVAAVHARMQMSQHSLLRRRRRRQQLMCVSNISRPAALASPKDPKNIDIDLNYCHY